MKDIKLKGIGAGILAAVVLSFPLGLMFIYYFSAIYNDLAPGVNLTNEAEIGEFLARFIYHPLTIAYGVISILIGVGIPAYISALVAGRAFVLHSMAIGSLLSLSCVIEWETLSQFPYLFAVYIGFTMVVAYIAGYLRKRQVLASAA